MFDQNYSASLLRYRNQLATEMARVDRLLDHQRHGYAEYNRSARPGSDVFARVISGPPSAPRLDPPRTIELAGEVYTATYQRDPSNTELAAILPSREREHLETHSVKAAQAQIPAPTATATRRVPAPRRRKPKQSQAA